MALFSAVRRCRLYVRAVWRLSSCSVLNVNIGYMLCKKYGVDTQNFAINRIPEKLAGKEPKDIRYELSKTRNAMADIHSRVSDELYKKKQERSKDYER